MALAAGALLIIPLAFGLREPDLASGNARPEQSIGGTGRGVRLPELPVPDGGLLRLRLPARLHRRAHAELPPDHGLTPEVATTALALIGLFNVFGTYAAGSLGQRLPKRYLLSAIYALRSASIVAFLWLPLSPWTVYAFAAVMGLLWLSGPADERDRRAHLRRAVPVDAGRLRVPVAPGRQLPRRLARRPAVRRHAAATTSCGGSPSRWACCSRPW